MKLINSNMHQIPSLNYNILHKKNSEKILPTPQNSEHSYTDTHFSHNSTTQTDTYENDNSIDESLLPVNNNTFKDDICNPKTINIDYNENNLLNNLNEDNETDFIRINDDLSNLEEILNSSSQSLDKNCCINLDKPIQKLHYSIDNTTSDLNTIPLLDNEDYSEENWGNILMNPKKKKPIYLTPNRKILMRNLNSKVKTKSIGLIQNGNKIRFMSIKSNDGFYALPNTCAFDSVIQLLVVAYCDSDDYGIYVKEKKMKIHNGTWFLPYLEMA